MKRKYFHNHSLRHALPFAAACFTVGLTLFACADKDVETNDNNGKALVAFNVSTVQNQAQAAAKSNQPVTRVAFAHQLALQNLAPEDLTMQKLPVQGAAASSDICLIETTVAGVPSQWEDGAPTRANITTMPTMQNFSTTAFYGSSDASLEPWFYDKDTKKDGTLVTPIYWDWIKNHACFYAVYPKPDNNKLKLSPVSYAGTPYVDFEVEPNVRNQKDLMTACSGNVHLDAMGTAPRTDLTFRHALTAVRFKVGQNLSYSKHITKVEIVGAKSKCKYTLPTDKTVTGSWDASTLNAPATFTLGGDGTVSVSTSEAVNSIIVGKPSDNYVFYMIPQTLTGAGVQAKFYFDGATTPSISVPLTGQWKPGTTKTYALSQNTSTWQYELTVTPPAAAEYNATSTGYYTIQSYREDPVTHTQQKVAWKVVGYDTDGDGTFSMTEPWPNWLKGISLTSGDGSTSGETGQATLNSGASSNKLALRNAALKLNPKGSSTNYYDLSTYDYEGNSTNRNTANCYVISHPGYYKIPLVYGNAITNGSPNTHAYTSNAAPGNPYVLYHFKDHNNADITDPWIEKTNGGANNGIDGAEVVWADVANLVHLSSTPISHDASGNAFLDFEVKASDIQSGNAVVAVKKGSTIVWSWHLWFAPQDALSTIAVTNFQGKTYNFTKETLGWKPTLWSSSTYSSARTVKVKVEQTVANGGTKQYSVFTITQNPGSVKQGATTFYQFGRKDAFPGVDDLAPNSSFIEDAGNNMSIQNGIQNPGSFYTYGNSWYFTPPAGYSYYNLWSADNTVTGHNDNPVVKTVYDPCPVGFKMPASNAFTGFTTTGQNSGTQSELNVDGTDNRQTYINNFGHNFWTNGSKTATINFPASGYRGSEGGSLGSVGDNGYYWSAVPLNSDYCCNLDFRSFYVYPLYDNDWPYGFAVRPVSDN